VTDGCLLNAKAQGCTLGPAGANPCKPCGPGQVRGWLDNNNNLGCIDKALQCDLEQTGFSGCPAGYEVGGVNGSTVQCLPCKPHTYNNDNAGGAHWHCGVFVGGGGSLLRAQLPS